MSDLLVAFAVLHVLLLIAAAAGQCRARVRVNLEVDWGQLETVVVVPAPLAAPPVLPPVPAPAKQNKRKLTKALKAANWKLGSTKWTASRGRQRQTGVCCERRCSETYNDEVLLRGFRVYAATLPDGDIRDFAIQRTYTAVGDRQEAPAALYRKKRHTCYLESPERLAAKLSSLANWNLATALVELEQVTRVVLVSHQETSTTRCVWTSSAGLCSAGATGSCSLAKMCTRRFAPPRNGPCLQTGCPGHGSNRAPDLTMRLVGSA